LGEVQRSRLELSDDVAVLPYVVDALGYGECLTTVGLLAIIAAGSLVVRLRRNAREAAVWRRRFALSGLAPASRSTRSSRKKESGQKTTKKHEKKRNERRRRKKRKS